MFTRLGMEMNEYFNLMKRIAIAYNNASDTGVRDELKRKFLAMYDHITDQGVAYGAAGAISTTTVTACVGFSFLTS